MLCLGQLQQFCSYTKFCRLEKKPNGLAQCEPSWTKYFMPDGGDADDDESMADGDPAQDMDTIIENENENEQ